jgi:HTH-type transcriptional regulator/antitoxin HipB
MRQKMKISGPQSLGRLVQQSRLAAGLTQVELAQELGISQRAITDIETGKATIQVRRLFDLLKMTGASLGGEWDTADE